MEIFAVNLHDTVGILGVIFYLGSYAALQLGLIQGQSYVYAVLNIIAASCVLFSLGQTFNLSSAIIQSSWILISLAGITRLVILNKRIRFSAEEQEFVDARLPALPKHLARDLLNRGQWVDGEAGTVLAREGEHIDELIFFARGAASVEIEGNMIGNIRTGSYIGELTAMSDEPASATIRVTQPSRYFCIGVTQLKQLISRNTVFRNVVADSFFDDTKLKLIAQNRQHPNLSGQSREDDLSSDKAATNNNC